MDFSTRSYQPELLDRDDIPFLDIDQNMKELETINRWLGGHRITLAGMEKLVAGRSFISVCEIGCGGGDNLRAIQAWCAKKNIQATLLGIDINPDCIQVARSRNGVSSYLVADYRTVSFDQEKPDIIFSSLFCHHFAEDDLVAMLDWMRSNAKTGFFINDLHRHLLPYYAIKILTASFSKSYLVKNDAPLSVRRGFVRKDWMDLLRRAEIHHFSLKWKWAFRWLITASVQQSIGK
jgi:2-polyprenyl-3-methyl-5-hydroxy-6-metoxy-1,4-benzoquinol methylase